MRAGLVYAKLTVSWRLWAIGWHDYHTKSRKYRVICIALGPLRFHFIDWGSRNWGRLKGDNSEQFSKVATKSSKSSEALQRSGKVLGGVQSPREREHGEDSERGEKGAV